MIIDSRRSVTRFLPCCQLVLVAASHATSQTACGLISAKNTLPCPQAIRLTCTNYDPYFQLGHMCHKQDERSLNPDHDTATLPTNTSASPSPVKRGKRCLTVLQLIRWELQSSQCTKMSIKIEESNLNICEAHS